MKNFVFHAKTFASCPQVNVSQALFIGTQGLLEMPQEHLLVSRGWWIRLLLVIVNGLLPILYEKFCCCSKKCNYSKSSINLKHARSSLFELEMG